MINQSEDDPVYLEWLAAAPKGVRWDRAQEMYAVYQERRRRQAEDVAKRLLGNPPNRCPTCGNVTRKVHGLGFCSMECVDKWEDQEDYA